MNPDMVCRPDERLEDLQRNGLRILQKQQGYRFGMDAVLLAHFATLRTNDCVADLGTGSGVLPLLMSQWEPTSRFYAFELQAELADMARRSVALNQLEKRITVYQADLRTAPEVLGRGRMDAVVCNPPYGERGSGTVSPGESRRLAMQETECTLQDVLDASAALLKNRGRLWICLPARRTMALWDAMRARRLEPKRARLICAKANKPPYLLLTEGVKNANNSLSWMPPLIACHADGTPTDELKALYGEYAEPDAETARSGQ